MMNQELYTALHLAMNQFKPVEQNGNNPHFRSKFSTYEDILNAVRKALFDNKLVITQRTRIVSGELILETNLTHVSGQTLVSEYPISPMKPDPQSVGSAITYAKRYALSAFLCLVTDIEDDGVNTDDDGNAATNPPDPSSDKKDANPVVNKVSATPVLKLPQEPKSQASSVEAKDGLGVNYIIKSNAVGFVGKTLDSLGIYEVDKLVNKLLALQHKGKLSPLQQQDMDACRSYLGRTLK